jgi:hypothetical protein
MPIAGWEAVRDSGATPSGIPAPRRQGFRRHAVRDSGATPWVASWVLFADGMPVPISRNCRIRPSAPWSITNCSRRRRIRSHSVILRSFVLGPAPVRQLGQSAVIDAIVVGVLTGPLLDKAAGGRFVLIPVPAC